MSAWAKLAGWVTAYLVVGVWAWFHATFNGSSLLLILALSVAAVWFSHSRPRRGVWKP